MGASKDLFFEEMQAEIEGLTLEERLAFTKGALWYAERWISKE